MLTLTIQGDPGDTALAFSSFGQHPTYVSELGGASLLADRTFLGVVPLAGSGAGRWKLRVPEGVMPAEAPVLPACIQS